MDLLKRTHEDQSQIWVKFYEFIYDNFYKETMHLEYLGIRNCNHWEQFELIFLKHMYINNNKIMNLISHKVKEICLINSIFYFNNRNFFLNTMYQHIDALCFVECYVYLGEANKKANDDNSDNNIQQPMLTFTNENNSHEIQSQSDESEEIEKKEQNIENQSIDNDNSVTKQINEGNVNEIYFQNIKYLLFEDSTFPCNDIFFKSFPNLQHLTLSNQFGEDTLLLYDIPLTIESLDLNYIDLTRCNIFNFNETTKEIKSNIKHLKIVCKEYMDYELLWFCILNKHINVFANLETLVIGFTFEIDNIHSIFLETNMVKKPNLNVTFAINDIEYKNNHKLIYVFSKYVKSVNIELTHWRSVFDKSLNTKQKKYLCLRWWNDK